MSRRWTRGNSVKWDGLRCRELRELNNLPPMTLPIYSRRLWGGGAATAIALSVPLNLTAATVLYWIKLEWTVSGSQVFHSFSHGTKQWQLACMSSLQVQKQLKDKFRRLSVQQIPFSFQVILMSAASVCNEMAVCFNDQRTHNFFGEGREESQQMRKWGRYVVEDLRLLGCYAVWTGKYVVCQHFVTARNNNSEAEICCLASDTAYDPTGVVSSATPLWEPQIL
jgi:hypothetical protein